MKKFALHVDHFIPNETAQVVKLHLEVVSHGAGPCASSYEYAIIEFIVRLLGL